MRRIFLAGLCLTVALAGCRAKELAEKVGISRELARNGSTTDLMKQVADDKYTAPKKAGDKSLAGLVEGFKTMGSVADLVTADIRAARDLGYNTHGYMWVKGQISILYTYAAADESR